MTVPTKNYFQILFTIFGADRDSSSKSKGCGVLTAASPRFRAYKRKNDSQFYGKCLWVQTTTHDDRLLICNLHFAPDTKPDIITKCFCSLDNILILKITVFF